MTLGERLRMLRVDHGWNQSDAAKPHEASSAARPRDHPLAPRPPRLSPALGQQHTKMGDGQPMTGDEEALTMTEHQQDAEWNAAEWHGKMLVDRDGERIGKLQDVYVDVENDEPQFGTVKEGFIGRHLTFVPLGGIKVGPDELQVAVAKEQVESAPNIELHGEELSQADESALYHHYELNYTPPSTESGRRLARR